MRALIADDQPAVTEALRLLLKHEGYQAEVVHSPKAVLENLSEHEFDLLLMDLNYARDTTSGEEGLELLGHVRKLDASLPIVVMTAWGNIPLAVEAIRRGARDFVEKPWDNARLLATIRQQAYRRSVAQLAAREELRDAVTTQQALLPKTMPAVAGCTMAAAWEPLRAVGGDYLDVIPLAEGRLGIAVGDAAGKGLAAGLLMSNLQAAVRALASDTLPPRVLASRVNRVLLPNLASNKFITFFYGVLAGRCLTYTNAGHHAPMLVRANGNAERLDAGGPVLGIFQNCAYQQAEIAVHPGDRLVLFTDGLIEAENHEGLEFGEARLLQLIRSHRAQDARSLLQTIMTALRSFAGTGVADDVTVVACAFE